MPANPSDLGVYIIHLERRSDRMKAVDALKSYFANRSCDVHVITGLDGHKASVLKEWVKWKMSHAATMELQFCDENTAKVHRQVWTEHLTDGEIGCAVSHYRAWTKASEGGHKYVLIFEDDCDLGTFKLGKLRSVLADLEEALKEPADMVRLAFSKDDPMGSVRKRDTNTNRRTVSVSRGSSSLVEDSCSWMGAYVLSAAGCKKLASCGLDIETINVDDFIYALSGAHPRTDLRAAPQVIQMAKHSKWTAFRLFMGNENTTWPCGVLKATRAGNESDTRDFPTAGELMEVEADKISAIGGGIYTTQIPRHASNCYYSPKLYTYIQIYRYLLNIYIFKHLPIPPSIHPSSQLLPNFTSENGRPARYENVGHRGTASEQCTIKIVSFRAT